MKYRIPDCENVYIYYIYIYKIEKEGRFNLFKTYIFQKKINIERKESRKDSLTLIFFFIKEEVNIYFGSLQKKSGKIILVSNKKNDFF